MSQLIDEFGAARLLSLRTCDVRRLVRSGQIPTVELPGVDYVRFDPEALHRWAMMHTRQPVLCRPVRETVQA